VSVAVTGGAVPYATCKCKRASSSLAVTVKLCINSVRTVRCSEDKPVERTTAIRSADRPDLSVAAGRRPRPLQDLLTPGRVARACP
jgi:hypothetical protein